MCKLPVSEEPHLWPLLQTELWVEMAKLPKAVSLLTYLGLLRILHDRRRWPQWSDQRVRIASPFVSFLHHGQAGLGWKGVALPLG